MSQRRSSHTGAESPSLKAVLLDSGSPMSTPGFTPPIAPFARVSRAASVQSFYSDSPYGGPGTRVSSLVEKFDLGPDPRLWGAELSLDYVEDDDELHRPTAGKSRIERDGNFISTRGVANLGCTAILILGLLALFAGYPIIRQYTAHHQSTLGAFNLGGTNASGQVPSMPGGFALIDPETPAAAYTMPSWNGREDMELVFSDEFNLDGRSFYPGDDPYWEAVDLHYAATNNLEWYDPEAVTTSGGSLTITLSAHPEHNLGYQGGMLSTWNKFCFTGGYIETSVILPGLNNIAGLWPAVWTMGNLGRAGYTATTDGLWPYSYDACDVGTVANQSIAGVPAAVLTGNDAGHDGKLSFLPGQRLSRCTCDEDADMHPGPKHSNGEFVGRSAPEIDIFEAQVGLVEKDNGEVSQSAQWAPFNIKYDWFNTPENMVIADSTISKINTYTGGIFQQATSIVTKVNQACYEKTGQCYSTYGFEYKPGFDDAYITWVSDNKVSWTLNVAGMAADTVAEIAGRPVPQEPMYIIANLGMSRNFGAVDLPNIPFPVTMFVDYIRVYQPKGSRNVGCDPKGFPTGQYIEKYKDMYTNPNLTTWAANDDGSGYNQTMPKNSFLGQC